jgi:hypothetical protein
LLTREVVGVFVRFYCTTSPMENPSQEATSIDLYGCANGCIEWEAKEDTDTVAGMV